MRERVSEREREMEMEWREMETGMEMEMDLACFDGELTLVGGLDHALPSQRTGEHGAIQYLTVSYRSRTVDLCCAIVVFNNSLWLSTWKVGGMYSRPLVGRREPGDLAREKNLSWNILIGLIASLAED